MAPEQATFNVVDIDTRADIYALGVILYELLAGSTPIPRETFKRAALDEMMRMVREVEPPTPSSRISSSDARPNIAANRHSEPDRLSRFVRGDLDWIVMKALAKDRHRRYDSPIALAQDIERFTNHEPVTAGPPTATYRFRKFVRRNRGRVVVASLVLVGLVVGIVGTTLGLFEADRQRGIAVARRKEAEKRLSQKDKANEILLSIFRELNPRRGEKETESLSYRLGKRLDVATAELEKEATDDPLGVARMQMALGQAQLDLGNYEQAGALFTKARATFASRLGPEHSDTLWSIGSLAMSYQLAGKLDSALPLMEETLALMKTQFGPDHLDTLASMNNLAVGYLSAGKVDLALPLYEKTLALRKAKLGPDDAQTLVSMGNLSEAYLAAGKLELALPLLEETLALMKVKLGPGHQTTLTCMNNLASCYRNAGKLDLALPLYEETLSLRKTNLGPDHPDTLTSMNSLAAGYWSAGKLNRSIPLLEEALKLRIVKSGTDDAETWRVRANLGVNYRDAGRLADAVPLLEAARRASREHPFLRPYAAELLAAYMRARQFDKATALAKELLAEGRAAMPPDSPQLSGLLAQMGSTFLDLEEWAEAEPILRECLAMREKVEPEAWRTFNTKSMVGATLLGQKKYAEAEPLLKAGYDGMKQRVDKIPPQAKNYLVAALDRLIALAEATGNADDLKKRQEEKAMLRPAAIPTPETEKK